MTITVHALERYNERIIKSESPLDARSFKARIISNRILNNIKTNFKEFGLEGYYQIEENVYALVIDNSVITVISHISNQSFLEVESCKNRNKKNISNKSFHKSQRKQQTKNLRKSRRKDSISVTYSSIDSGSLLEKALRKANKEKQKELQEKNLKEKEERTKENLENRKINEIKRSLKKKQTGLRKVA